MCPVTIFLLQFLSLFYLWIVIDLFHFLHFKAFIFLSWPIDFLHSYTQSNVAAMIQYPSSVPSYITPPRLHTHFRTMLSPQGSWDCINSEFLPVRPEVQSQTSLPISQNLSPSLIQTSEKDLPRAEGIQEIYLTMIEMEKGESRLKFLDY